MNTKAIRFFISKILFMLGVSLIIPLIVAFIYDNALWDKLSFVIVGISLVGISYLVKVKSDKNLDFGVKDGLLATGFAWLSVCLCGSLPYIISGTIPNFFDAFYETVSGFTTTGGSVFGGIGSGIGIKEINQVSESFLLYRSMTQWIGGIGILVFILTMITDKNEKNSIHLLRAESTGVDVGKLTSKMKITTRILVIIYIFLTALEALFLTFDPDINIFQAICTSFSTTATGGFSIGITFSTYAQYVIAITMLLSGINFTIYFLIIIGKFKQAFKNEELKCYLLIILISIILIMINTYKMYKGFEQAFRNVFFTVTSIITTTGFGPVDLDFTSWPTFSKIILVIIMTFGSCAGSTAGGMKISRILIVSKHTSNKIRHKSSPDLIRTTKLNDEEISNDLISETHIFIVIYVAITIICALLLSLDNIPGSGLETHFTASLTSISNVGPGLTPNIGPNGTFADYNWFSKLIMSFEMLIGRLELFPILALFNYRTYKKF